MPNSILSRDSEGYAPAWCTSGNWFIAGTQGYDVENECLYVVLKLDPIATERVRHAIVYDMQLSG